MKTATPPASTSHVKKSDPVAESLATLLADTYALMGQVHVAHWNVEGPNFYSLHLAFEEQYKELFKAVDELAERLRALGFYAPGGLKTLASMSSIKEAKIEETPAENHVAHLIAGHEAVVKSAEKAREIAGEHDDNETEDLVIGRVKTHQKALWMLRSVTKAA
ncbi:Dps family protein [Luteolibacter algae]|uniref:Dps family protein n=1 Tax=Luteolibacter algae TaxID=454151 RepID=A0ABW5D8B3_9BACT